MKNIKLEEMKMKKQTMNMQLRSKVKLFNQNLDSVGTTGQPNKRGRKKIINSYSMPSTSAQSAPEVIISNGSPDNCVQIEPTLTDGRNKKSIDISSINSISNHAGVNPAIQVTPETNYQSENSNNAIHIFQDPIKFVSNQYTCEICENRYNSIQAIKCHYKIKHNQTFIENIQINNKYEIQCDKCVQKFKNPAHLKSHYKLRHHEKLVFNNLTCSKCDFSTNEKRNMEKHVLAEHQDVYICSICNKSYSNIRSLNNHKRSHSENFNLYNNLDLLPHIINCESNQIKPSTGYESIKIKIKAIDKPIIDKASKREKHKKILIQTIHQFIQESNQQNIDIKYEELLKAINKLTKSLRIYHGINNSNNYFIRKNKNKIKEHQNISIEECAKSKENQQKLIEDDMSIDETNIIEDYIDQMKTNISFNKNSAISSNSKYQNKDLINQFFKNPRNCYRLITNNNEQPKITSSKEEVFQHYRNIWSSSGNNFSNQNGSILSDESDLFTDFEENEILESMEKMNQRSSNGTDKIHFLVWKFLNKKTNILGYLFNHFLRINGIPNSWKESRTILLTKNKDKESELSNLRPITISNSIYRIFSNTIKNRLDSILSVIGYISRNQKGFQSKINGCLEHSFTIKSIIDESRNMKKNCEIFFIDIKAAFDKVDHQFILNKMRDIGLKEKDIYFLNLMLKGHTSIKVNEENTNTIYFHAGVKQGDPISPLLFNIAINEAIHCIESENNKAFNTNILAYADDITLIANSKNIMYRYIRKLKEKLAEADLKINYNKCKSLSLCHEENMKVIQNNYMIDGKSIESIKYESTFNYLGRNIDLKSTYESVNLGKITTNLDEDLEKLKLVNLPNWIKISLIKLFIISKFNFILSLSKVKKSDLKPIDDKIKNVVTEIYRLPKSTTTNILYMATKNGGLGIRKLNEDKNLMRISSLINLLNTRDENLFEIINKKIQNMLGTNSNTPTIKLIQELFEFDLSLIHKCSDLISESIRNLKKMGLQIIMNSFAKFDINIENNYDNQKTTPLRKLRHQISLNYFNNLDKLQDQGRYIRTTSRNSASNYFMSPFKGLASEIQEFAIKARLNQLATPANYKKWNLTPKFYSAKCPICPTSVYNLSHILNGCARYRKLYTERHDSILEIIRKHSKIKLIINERTLINESPLRPDIQIYEMNESSVIYADLAISTDLMDTIKFSAANKISKYSVFEDPLKDKGFRSFKIIPIIIGSLGTIQNNLAKNLTNVGIPEINTKKVIKIIVKDVLEKSFQIYLKAKSEFPMKINN